MTSRDDGQALTETSPVKSATTVAPIGPVVLVGAGLVGASIGQALTAAGSVVHLQDRQPSHARVAATLGAGTTDAPVADDVALVVVAVPPAAIADTVSAALATFPHATVTDVGSVKSPVLHAVWVGDRGRHADRRSAVSRYVGSHPMAGSQHSGPLTARPDLFVDRTWVITPHRRSAPESIERVRALVAACGAVEITMDVEDHDTAVARVSHLPHLVSVLMAGHLVDVPDHHLRLAGQGLRDVTRIAGSEPELWDQILSANTAAVVPELRAVQADLQRMIDAVQGARHDGEALHRTLERGVHGTRAIPGKHGSAARTYVPVVIAIPDTPGALARLFADVDAEGINVEDIAIEHDAVREVGYLAVSVSPTQAPALTAAMVDRGWDVQP